MKILDDLLDRPDITKMNNEVSLAAGAGKWQLDMNFMDELRAGCKTKECLLLREIIENLFCL